MHPAHGSSPTPAEHHSRRAADNTLGNRSGPASSFVEPEVLEAEIAELRRQLDRLTAVRDELVNIYVFGDDDAEARAFDEFYSAYDEVHAKTRSFLLG